MEALRVGMELIHKTQKIKCKVIGITDDKMRIKLYSPLQGKYEISLKRNSMGEFLFLDEKHIEYQIEELAQISLYSENEKIISFKKEQERRKKEAESKQLKEKESNTEKIKEILKKRKIKYLVHFTSMRNLKSILENGILSRDIVSTAKLSKQGYIEDLFGNDSWIYADERLSYDYNDVARFDYRSDCSCFSVEFPNDILFKKFRSNYPDRSWVVLAIDANILVDGSREIYYCYNNAANRYISDKIKQGELTKPEDFENLFKSEFKLENDGEQVLVDRNNIQNIKSYLPTMKQAEILIKGKIEPSYIKCIIFDGKYDLNRFNSERGNKELIEKFNRMVTPKFFKYREKVIFEER